MLAFCRDKLGLQLQPVPSHLCMVLAHQNWDLLSPDTPTRKKIIHLILPSVRRATCRPTLLYIRSQFGSQRAWVYDAFLTDIVQATDRLILLVPIFLFNIFEIWTLVGKNGSGGGKLVVLIFCGWLLHRRRRGEGRSQASRPYVRKNIPPNKQ